MGGGLESAIRSGLVTQIGRKPVLRELIYLPSCGKTVSELVVRLVAMTGSKGFSLQTRLKAATSHFTKNIPERKGTVVILPCPERNFIL